jgi:aspartate aminotransferase-like enzyme
VGSQKAFMTPPGLAAVAVSPKAWELVERSSSPRYYFDFRKARKKMAEREPQTPFTPAISLVRAMSVAVEMMLKEGLENVWERHRVLAECCRAGVKALGLELFPKDLTGAYAVTAVRVPEGLDGRELVRHMNRRHGVILAGGQDQLKGKIFRIGHVGYYNFFDLVTALSALELSLRELGVGLRLGTGLAAAEEKYLELTGGGG